MIKYNNTELKSKNKKNEIFIVYSKTLSSDKTSFGIGANDNTVFFNVLLYLYWTAIFTRRYMP